MGKKIILLFIFIFLSFSFTSAFDFGASATSVLGTTKQDGCITLYQSCPSCTYVNLTAIQYPNKTIILNEIGMSKSGTEYTYEFCNTSNLGGYFYTTIGDKNGVVSTETISFEVTYGGDSVSSSQATLYAVLLFVLIFVFIVTILGINQLPSSNTKDEEGKILSISYLKYLRPVGWFFLWMLFIAILFLSSNIAFAFLGEQLFAKTLHMLFRVCFGFTPIIVVVWIIWIYRQMFHDKQMQNMLNRGIFPQGKL